MLRTIICAATLFVIATAAQVEAGGFKGKFSGGNGHNNHQHNNHNNYANHHKYQQHTYHYGYQQQHYVKPYRAPVQYHAPVQYYQVCYHCDAWGYHKYQSFTCPKQAAAYVGQLQVAGYNAEISPTHQPYANGHIIYKQQQYNHWMP